MPTPVHIYTSGRLLDATTDERLNEGTSYRRAIYTVPLGDIVYTLRAKGCGPTPKT